MARARLLKPQFFTNKALAEIPPYGRLLFQGLWTLADKKGRLKDSPKFIEGSLFPYEKVPVGKLLDQLDGLGFIYRYCVEGEDFIQVIHFTDHQTPNQHEPDSNIPPPEDVRRGSIAPPEHMQGTEDAHAMHMQSTAVIEAVMEAVTVVEAVGAESAAKTPRTRRRELAEEDVAELKDEFPTVDVERQAMKYRDWCLAKGSPHKDQVAGFRNWLRTEEEHAAVQRYTPGRNAVGGESKIAAFARREGLG